MDGSQDKLRYRLYWLLPVGGLGLIAWALFTAWQEHRTVHEITLSISAGEQTTRRHAIACFLAEYASLRGVQFQFQESPGSEDCLQRVEEGELQVALVTGAIDRSKYPRVRQLAALCLEPLHCLVKRQLLASGDGGLEVLRGRRIDLGPDGGATAVLAGELLAYAGLHPQTAQAPGDFLPTAFSRNELVARARALRRASPERRRQLSAELPDVVFLVSSLPSEVARELVAAADYQLLPLPYERAFTADSLHHVGQAQRKVDRRYVDEVTIPAFTYGITPPLPTTDCQTLGMRLLVVTNQEVPTAVLDPLLATIYEGPFAHEMQPPDLLEVGSEYPLHPAASLYLDRRRPLTAKDLTLALQGLLSMLGAGSAGGLALYGYVRRRRALQPAHYLQELHNLEELALSRTSGSSAAEPGIQTEQLEQLLRNLKQRLLADWAAGHLPNDVMLANLLAALADTRQTLIQSRGATEAFPGPRVTLRRRGSSAA